MKRTFIEFTLLFLFTISLFQTIKTQNEEWNIRYHMNSKTMYWIQQDATTYTPPPSGCEAVQLNYLSRHGARYPTNSDISKFNSLADTMHQYSQYYLPPYQWMSTWINPYKEENSGLLTYLGQVELYNAAQRVSTQLNPILSDKYKPYTYPMQSTQVSRAGQSGTSFGFSVQQKNGHLPPYQGSFQPFFIYSDSENEDFQLRFFDNCPLYTTEVLDNSTASEQATLFSDMYMVPLGLNISKQIGVYPHWNISSSQVNTFYKICAFELSIQNDTSHFCSIFNEDQAAIVEYYNDLQDYYEKGYGHLINYEIACPLLNDFFNITDEYVVYGDSQVKSKLRFAHAETHMPFISLLGLYEDESPLMANWTWEQINNRKWKSSIISPFAAQVQSILYKCPNVSPSGYMLRLLMNEKEMVLPPCTGVYCDYNQVKNYYAYDLTCPFVDYCYPAEQAVCEEEFCAKSPAFNRPKRRSVLDTV